MVSWREGVLEETALLLGVLFCYPARAEGRGIVIVLFLWVYFFFPRENLELLRKRGDRLSRVSRRPKFLQLVEN